MLHGCRRVGNTLFLTMSDIVRNPSLRPGRAALIVDRMQIALMLYPTFTALDIIGPFQVFADVPGVDVVFVAEEQGPVVDHTGHCRVLAEATFAEVDAPDVVVVPGSTGGYVHPPALDWLIRVHPTTTWTTSVCTGSLYLAEAGLLRGLEATTHWARAGRLEQLGAVYTAQRVVEQGRIVTAAGVSAGIDMGLVLLDRMFGAETAQAIQLSIEYDPQPPFDAGSPSKAPAAVLELLTAHFAQTALDGRSPGETWCNGSIG